MQKKTLKNYALKLLKELLRVPKRFKLQDNFKRAPKEFQKSLKKASSEL